MTTQPMRTNLNLLPAWYRRRVLLRAALTLWACTWTLGIAAASLFVWRVESRSVSVRRELAKFERMYAPVQAMARDVQTMKQRLNSVEAEEKAAATLQINRPPLALLGVVSEAAKACHERLHLRECRLERRLADRGAADTGTKFLTLKGAALDLSSVARFHAALRDADMFDRVELKSTTHSKIENVNAHDFHVECVF